MGSLQTSLRDRTRLLAPQRQSGLRVPHHRTPDRSAARTKRTSSIQLFMGFAVKSINSNFERDPAASSLRRQCGSEPFLNAGLKKF